jgi:hypothetical protein
VIFYLLFLIWSSYHQAKRAGRHVPITSLVLIGPAIVSGFVLDIVWNFVIGALLFLEAPWASLTFTARLISWKNDQGWRGAEARWWATLLNWADPDHV